jgi:hypothetical protein
MDSLLITPEIEVDLHYIDYEKLSQPRNSPIYERSSS